jgi:hypothetical protein
MRRAMRAPFLATAVLGACTPTSDHSAGIDGRSPSNSTVAQFAAAHDYASLEDRRSPAHKLARSAAATAVTDATHFDLDCSVVFRIISRGSEGMGNALALFTGDRAVATFRFVVDLSSMRSCVAGSCEEYGTRTIVRADADTITFEDERGEDWHRFDRYDRRTGRYIRRIITDGGWNLLHTGTCRRRPFSGLPDRVSEGDRPPSV